MSKTQWSSKVLFVALIFPVAKPMARTRSPCATNSGGFGNEVSIVPFACLSKFSKPACARCIPASGQSSPGMIHSISSAHNASKPCLSRRPRAAKKSFTIWTFFSMLIESLLLLCVRCVRLNRTVGTIRLRPGQPDDDRLRFLFEQILEDEWTPSAAAGVHQRATLVELSQIDGGEPEFLGQIRYGSDRVP